MLLKITNQCHEGCSHCMENSLPTEPHMEWSTLRDAVKFMNFNMVGAVVISGGEPTCDPEFEDKIKYVHNKMPNSVFTIQSNGSFIFDESKTEKVRRLMELDRILMLQVSTHKKYYPNYDKTMGMKSAIESISYKVKFVADWQGSLTNIQRLGRAVNLKDEDFKGNPGCAPIFSRSNQLDMLIQGTGLTMDQVTLAQFIKLLEMNNYLCKPLLNITGYLHVGECPQCVKVGDINGFGKLSDEGKNKLSHDVLMSMVNGHMCNKCGQVMNLKGKVPDIVLKTKSFKIV